MTTARPTAPAAPSPRDPRGRGARAALVTTGALAGVLLAALPASAHDRLVSSDPESGAVLTGVPAEAVLTFSSEVQELGTVLEVHDDAGGLVSDAETQVEGRDVVIAVPADLGAGDYEVVYRVTSSDGHPISGQVPFTLDVAAPAPTSPTTTAPAPPAEPAPTTSAPAAPPSSDVVDGSDAATTSAEADGGVPWTAVGVVAALVVLAGIAGAVLSRRRPRTR
ncbi:copper resistance CopC family protein [uncultured Pseudokineococcus sp.]|uniref:copper resistance CopC family protein n=1 Tax=uncultured Pseudokineococcus sp. TaxID=1642928 RepID=UPI00261C87CD|nr:copper resistance CopC family protein [uncultured Pseudokineococcus sp.]